MSIQDSARRITTSHHLRLVSQIYRQQDKKDELLALFENPEIGIRSTVGKNDAEFTRLELKVLKEDLRKNADRIIKLTYPLLAKLVDAKSENDSSQIEALSGADDWFTWSALIEASSGNSK
jgi:hypothetical protein